MHISTGAGWHYGSVHVSTPPHAPAGSRGATGRRTVLAVALSVATVGALSACVVDEPEPDADLQALVQQLESMDGSTVAGGTAMFTEQADALAEEIVRQCGTDREGNPPENCGVSDHGENGEESDGSVTVTEVRTSMLDLIDDWDGGDRELERDRAVLLTGLYAALATIEDSDAGGPAIGQDLLDEGFPSASVQDGDSDDAVADSTAEALAPVTGLVNQAVYLSGMVLPVSGDNRGTVTMVGDRMRLVRDMATAASGVPAEVGYSTPEGFTEPTDAASAAEALLAAVHAVTVGLRTAVNEVDEADRSTVAMLAAVSARSEAALEDAVGTDPLATSIRGE